MCSVALLVFAFFSVLSLIQSEDLYKNVALHKPCNMSSIHHLMQKCGDALNGNRAGQFRNNCVHTDSGDPTPTFIVNLGRPYPIKNIIIFARATYERRMGNCVIKVDDQVCYTFPEDTTSLPREMHVQCQRTLNGSIISITKTIDGQPNWDQTLNICELEVLDTALTSTGSTTTRVTWALAAVSMVILAWTCF